MNETPTPSKPQSTRPTKPRKVRKVRELPARRPRGEAPPAGPKKADLGERSEAHLRRTPRYGVFIFLGIVVALIATAIGVYTRPLNPRANYETIFIYASVFAVIIGGAAGGLVALILDNILLRSHKNALSKQGEKVS